MVETTENNIIICKYFWKILNGQGDNYTTGCLCYIIHISYKTISWSLNKHPALDADLKVIDFIGNQAVNGIMFFILKKKKTIFDFLQETVWISFIVLWIHFSLIFWYIIYVKNWSKMRQYNNEN